MATTGVVGQHWRAAVTATGSVEPWDGSPVLDWFVAADDRWHDPRSDTGVRHRRVDGTAVLETKVRIPGGDAVQRVWSVADAGGFTLVEVANDSPMPMACVFTRPDLVANRPPARVPIEGIEVPVGSLLLPVGHRSSVVVGLPHGGVAEGVGREGARLPKGLAGPDAVARGWRARTEHASRLDLPDLALSEAVRAARCEVLLTGADDPDDDPERFLLAVAELVRMAEIDPRDAASLAPEVADAVAAVAPGSSPLAGAALAAAGVVLAAAGETRARRDLAAIVGRTEGVGLRPAADGSDGADPASGNWAPDDIATVAAVEGRLARGPELFPAGLPSGWRGIDFEAHGLVVGPVSRLSLAVRWHGSNAAVLWELDGDPVTLHSTLGQGWHTDERTGEALWVMADADARFSDRCS